MKSAFFTQPTVLACSLVCMLASAASAVQIQSVTVFATGTTVGATAPDSIALSKDSVWVSYGNGADSTGAGGSSTIVQYDLQGNVVSTRPLAGSVDGLDIDPVTGLVWALQNQDGNSTLTLITPGSSVTTQYNFAVSSPSSGYDEAAFLNGRTFVSYTNPAGPTDPTIQLIAKGSNPITVTNIMTAGATGTDMTNGHPNLPTSQNDPDSLKVTPWGDLQLSSGGDGQLIFVHNPALPNQYVSFLQLLNPATGLPVSGLDDALFVTPPAGTFFLTDTKNNRVLEIAVTGISYGSLFASVGSLNELTLVDLRSGNAQPFLTGLNGPHGLAFLSPSPAYPEHRRH